MNRPFKHDPPLTAEEIARRFGLMRSVLGHRECSPANWETLQRVAEGYSIEELIGVPDGP